MWHRLKVGETGHEKFLRDSLGESPVSGNLIWNVLTIITTGTKGVTFNLITRNILPTPIEILRQKLRVSQLNDKITMDINAG